MARNITIKFIRTSRAALDNEASQGKLFVGEPYYITNEERFAIGNSPNTYTEFPITSDLIAGSVDLNTAVALALVL